MVAIFYNSNFWGQILINYSILDHLECKDFHKAHRPLSCDDDSDDDFDVQNYRHDIFKKTVSKTELCNTMDAKIHQDAKTIKTRGG